MTSGVRPSCPVARHRSRACSPASRAVGSAGRAISSRPRARRSRARRTRTATTTAARRCVAGKKACPGFRVRVEDLDGAVLAAIADLACTPERTQRLARRHIWPPTTEVMNAWRNFILRDADIGRTYALHLIEHVVVHGERIVITRKSPVEERRAFQSSRRGENRRRKQKEKREVLRPRVFSHYRELKLRLLDSNQRPGG